MPSISAELAYLRENGPTYPVTITLSFPAVEALGLDKKDAPSIKVLAMIDTGAQTTAISQKIVDQLQLVPRGTARVYTSHSHKILNEYDIALEFTPEMFLNTLRVLGAGLENHDIDCLIGRDVLQFGKFIYDGSGKKFTLSFLD